MLDVGERRAVEFHHVREFEQFFVNVEKGHVTAEATGQRGGGEPDFYRRLAVAVPVSGHLALSVISQTLASSPMAWVS